MKIEFVVEAKNAIIVSVFSGKVSKEDARGQLAGILAVLNVAEKESYSAKLKTQVAEIKSDIEATIENLA